MKDLYLTFKSIVYGGTNLFSKLFLIKNSQIVKRPTHGVGSNKYLSGDDGADPPVTQLLQFYCWQYYTEFAIFLRLFSIVIENMHRDHL